MEPKGMTLQQLTEKTKKIEREGGIGKKTAKLPSPRNDIVARTNRNSQAILKMLKCL